MNMPLLPRRMLDDVAQRFRLLGEPVRLELLNLLHMHDEMNVNDLVEATGQSQANVSKHLRLMAEEGLVRRRKEGLYAYYRINDPSLSGLCLLVCSQVQHDADLPAPLPSAPEPYFEELAAQ